MSFQDAIAGLEVLQRAFENKNTRVFDLEKMFKEQQFKTAERQATEAYAAGENEKNRKAEQKKTETSVGPEYARLKFQKDTQNRILGGYNEMANQLESGGIVTLSSTGRSALAGLRSGAITPIEANAMLPNTSDFDTLARLGQEGLVTNDPKLQAVMPIMVTIAKNNMALKTQNDILKKAYSGDPSKMQSYKIDPTKFQDQITEVYDSIQKKYGLEGFNLSDPDSPGFYAFLHKQQKENPNINPVAINLEAIDKLKNVFSQGDVDLANNPNSAQLAAVKMAEFVGLRGNKAFTNTTTYKADKDGVVGPAKIEPNYIDTGIPKDYFFSTNQQMNAEASVQKMRQSPLATPWNPLGKKMAEEIAQPQAPAPQAQKATPATPLPEPTQPVPIIDASSYLGNIQTKTPVTDTAKGLVTP